MYKIILFLLVVVCSLGLFNNQANAESYSVTGQGAGATSSINVQETDESSVHQSNTSDVTNSVGQNADTGGNSGGSVTTGDATSVTNINNSGNVNQFTDPCCGTPAISVTPDPKKPTPTGTSSNNGTGGSDINSGTDTNESSGVGGGDILGLSATSATDYDSLNGIITGILCLISGSLIIRKKLVTA